MSSVFAVLNVLFKFFWNDPLDLNLCTQQLSVANSTDNIHLSPLRKKTKKTQFLALIPLHRIPYV